MDKVTIEHH